MKGRVSTYPSLCTRRCKACKVLVTWANGACVMPHAPMAKTCFDILAPLQLVSDDRPTLMHKQAGCRLCEWQAIGSFSTSESCQAVSTPTIVVWDWDKLTRRSTRLFLGGQIIIFPERRTQTAHEVPFLTRRRLITVNRWEKTTSTQSV
jgi:hypothetical protein